MLTKKLKEILFFFELTETAFVRCFFCDKETIFFLNLYDLHICIFVVSGLVMNHWLPVFCAGAARVVIRTALRYEMKTK